MHAPRRSSALVLAAALLLSALAAVMAPAPSAAGHGQVPDTGWPTFRNVTDAAGLGGFTHGGWIGTGNLNDGTPLFPEEIGGGACWLDYDGDGLLDLYLTNNIFLTHTDLNAKYDPHASLYHNNGDGTFTDVSNLTHTRLAEMSQGCSAADYDNDGRTDLYVTGWNGSVLFHNQGDGTFSNATAAAGVRDDDCGAYHCWGTSATWLDYDRDGCLDLYVDNWGDFDPAHPPGGNGPEHVRPQVSRLYHSNCNGTFTDATAAAGISDRWHHWASMAIDMNADGWPDLYVANDGDPNTVLMNNGDGTFTNVSGLELNDPRHSMGVASADWNGDGRPDIIDPNYVSEYNGVFMSGPTGYVDVGDQDPFQDALPDSGWSAGAEDINNDGLPDIMVANGMTEWVQHGPDPHERNLAYISLGNGQFVNASDDVGPDFAQYMVSRGAAWADYDNDGAVDMSVSEAGLAPTHLYHNEGLGGNFVTIQLVGTARGVTRDAVGAKVVVQPAGGAAQAWWRVDGSGFLSSSDPRIHAGLGQAASADITVTWPDGSVERWSGVRANSFVRLTQGDASVTTTRALPLVTLAGPDHARRLAPVTLDASADLTDGASVASVAWDFGDGGTATGVSVTHAFTAVGHLLVRATVTDTLGRSKITAKPILVTDELRASIAMDEATYLPFQRITGRVLVTYDDGAPVVGAHVRVAFAHSTGNAAADALVHGAPRSVRDALADGTLTTEGTTDATGAFAFFAPWSEPTPSPFVPADGNAPGRYDVTGAADLAGSVSQTASAVAVVVAQLPPT